MALRQYPSLAKAPIVEALVDFRISKAGGKALEQLHALRSVVRDGYPLSEDLYRHSVEFKMGPRPTGQHPTDSGPVTSESREQIGFKVHSGDGRHIAMLTTEGFTFSRLRPYADWESLREAAEGLWERYRSAVEPERISRVALRYINRLELPKQIRDLGDYLTAPPAIPPRLPQALQGFVSRIVIPIPRVDGSAIITQQFAGLSEGEQYIVLLDIDVFKLANLPPDGQQAWELAARLRDEKNVIFFESITEQMELLCS